MGMNDSLRFRVGADFSDASRGLTQFAGRIGAAIGGVFSVAVAGRLTQSFVEAGSEMEQFESRLGTLMGSSAEARARMEELFDFAATTPFELGQIVAAETTLRGFGAAAEELMPGLIDFAATTGADMSQAAIDIGKAWSQGATGLESDFGRVLRKQIELSTGVNATTMELDDFREALMDTLGNGIFAGGADRLSKTFGGMMSNLRDEWTRFRLEVSDAGLFNNVKGALQVTLDLISDNRAAITDLASVTSTTLWKSFRLVAETIGVAATGVQSLRVALAFAVAPMADLAQAAIEFYEPLRQAAILMADRLGLDQVTRSMLALDGAMGGARSRLADIRDRSVEFVRETAAAQTPLETVRALLDGAEAAAAGMADEIKRAGSAATGMTATGTGDTADADAAYQEQLQAARDYIAELNAMDDSREERIRAQYFERGGRLMDLQEQGLLSEEEWAQGVLALRSDLAMQLGDLEEEGRQMRADSHEEALRQIEREKEERLDSYATQLGAFSSLMGSLSSLLESQGEKAKRTQKAFAYASIAIDTAVGIMKAFAQYGWPGGLIPAAAITAQGAVEAVAVAAAHQGGAFSIGAAAPDEVDIAVGGSSRRRVLKQETMAVGNSQVARRMNDANATNGASLGGPMVINFRVGRAAQREVIRGEARYGTYMRGFVGGLVTDRFAAGWSGAGAIA